MAAFTVVNDCTRKRRSDAPADPAKGAPYARPPEDGGLLIVDEPVAAGFALIGQNDKTRQPGETGMQMETAPARRGIHKR